MVFEIVAISALLAYVYKVVCDDESSPPPHTESEVENLLDDGTPHSPHSSSSED